MAATTRNRIERLEAEVRFRVWVRHQRWLESLSEKELEMWAASGQCPERPEPLPGMSPLDQMEREELQKLWKEGEQRWEGRNREDLAFFCLHGHWQEQACATNCRKRQEPQT
jgi:hypothetical protein